MNLAPFYYHGKGGKKTARMRNKEYYNLGFNKHCIPCRVCGRCACHGNHGGRNVPM